jgi:hypothetical protein
MASDKKYGHKKSGTGCNRTKLDLVNDKDFLPGINIATSNRNRTNMCMHIIW